MKSSESNFRNWFVNSLAALRGNGDAGFIFALIAFPLLERYLRNKSGCPEGQNLTDEFYVNLGLSLKEVARREREFWDCYRNGLSHQVTFAQAKLNRKTGIWIALPQAGISGHDSRPVYFVEDSNQFFLNPIVFFDFVTGTILSDFCTYEGTDASAYRLPSIATPFAGPFTTVPTINFNLPPTG